MRRVGTSIEGGGGGSVDGGGVVGFDVDLGEEAVEPAR